MMSREMILLDMEPLVNRNIIFDAIRLKGEGRVYVSFDLFLNFEW